MEKLDGIDLEEYSFKNLSIEDVVLPDNPRRSVVYSKLHTREELDRKITDVPGFRNVLRPKNRAMVPEDLTEDYARSQEELVLKKRRKLLDEDEAVALELAEMMEKSSGVSATWRTKESGEAGAAPAAATEGGGEPRNGETKNSETKGGEVRPSDSASDTVRPSLADSNPHLVITQRNSEGVAREPVGKTGDASAAAPTTTAAPVVADEAWLETVRKEAWEQAWKEGFSSGHSEGLEAGAAEAREAAAAEGYAKGLEEGFRAGEVRGEMVGEGKVSKAVDLIAELVTRIDHLRSEIVSGGQDIFVEFAKAACEGILRAQLAVQDESLRRFLVQTMSPFVEKSFLVLEVHPADAARVRGIIDGRSEVSRKVRVKENPNLAPGDFRVEADNEVVVVDLNKAVNGFIDEIKKEILSSEVTGRQKESA